MFYGKITSIFLIVTEFFLLLTTLQNFLLHRLSPFLSVLFYVIALVYHSLYQKKNFHLNT